jgi:hypothetical protein
VPIGVTRFHPVRLDRELIRGKEKGETFAIDEDLAGPCVVSSGTCNTPVTLALPVVTLGSSLES